MNTMISSSHYTDLSDFLAKHNAKNSEKIGVNSTAKTMTHT